MNNRSIKVNQQGYSGNQGAQPYSGQRWLVEERDACGVGFIASCGGSATHKLIEQALSALSCLEHRGGCSADQDSGDGAGLMTAIPWDVLQPWFAEQNLDMPPTQQLGVGMLFLPKDTDLLNKARATVEEVLGQEGLTVLGWRIVPVKDSVLGLQARENEPRIEQVIVQSPTKQGDELERVLFKAMRRISKALESDDTVKGSDNFYVCSFSTRTIVYKGMVRSAVLGEFYVGLEKPSLQKSLCRLPSTL
jgi:glutamate synthase (ferredoxin)